MGMRKYGVWSLVFLLMGMFFLLNSGFQITGAAIGESFLVTYSLGIGIIFIALSLVIFTTGNWVSSETLENILKGKISNKKKKTIQYLGRSHLNKGRGRLPENPNKSPEDTYREFFVVLEAEKHPSNEGVTEIRKKYTRENNLVVGGLGLNRATMYDAKTLNTKNRGAYRYVFDESGTYLGLARHTKSSGGRYRYSWA